MAGPVFIIDADGRRLGYGPAFVMWELSPSGAPDKPITRRRRASTRKLDTSGATAYMAAADLVRRVVDFSQRQPEWAECIIYTTLPDERWDLTLVSRRVYGNSNEWLAIMAAAGLDSVEEELTERRMLLPTLRQLERLKQLAGFVNDRWLRPAAASADPLNGR